METEIHTYTPKQRLQIHYAFEIFDDLQKRPHPAADCIKTSAKMTAAIHNSHLLGTSGSYAESPNLLAR